MRHRALLLVALVSAMACGASGKDEPDVKMSDVRPVVVELLESAIATVSDNPSPTGSPEPRPCFSGPPVEDLGTVELDYGFVADPSPGTAGEAAATITEYLTGADLTPLEPRVVGSEHRHPFDGDGFRIVVAFAEGEALVSVTGSTGCIDP